MLRVRDRNPIGGVTLLAGEEQSGSLAIQAAQSPAILTDFHQSHGPVFCNYCLCSSGFRGLYPSADQCLRSTSKDQAPTQHLAELLFLQGNCLAMCTNQRLASATSSHRQP